MTEKIKDIDIRIASAIEKLTQVQKVLLWDTAKKENLSPIQIQFIIFLDIHPPELRNVSVLAEEFDLTKATVSDAVSSLAGKGLLYKAKTEEDKRSHVIELTPEGKRAVKKVMNWQKELINNISGIPDEDKEKVYGFLTGLIKSLFDKGVINIARMCLTCGNVFIGAKGKPYTCSLTGRTFFAGDVNINCDGYSMKFQ